MLNLEQPLPKSGHTTGIGYHLNVRARLKTLYWILLLLVMLYALMLPSLQCISSVLRVDSNYPGFGGAALLRACCLLLD